MTDVERFRKVLAAVTEDPSATDICDALWLGALVDRPNTKSLALDAPEPIPVAFENRPAPREVPVPAPVPSAPRPPSTDSLPSDPPSTPVHLQPGAEGPASDGSFQPLAVPLVNPLHDRLALQRALRPLKRRVESRRLVTLDEVTTSENIADDRLREKVRSSPRRTRLALRPAEERWLRLDIVVDTGPTMTIWREHAVELERIMNQLGAFSTVQVWSLHLRGGTARISPLGRSDARRPPSAIYGVPGRQGVLVLSDCCGAGWWDGSAGKVLADWGRRVSVAVVQPLPEYLWKRTAVPAGPGSIRVSQPGLPTTRLRFSPGPDSAPAVTSGVVVPVLELSAPWFAGWAAIVAGMSSTAYPTAAAYVGAPRRSAPVPASETVVTPEERVLRFRAAASPEAFRLAGYVAMTVPAVPVMRLLQQAVFGRSTPTHLAEVVLSGLLRPASPGGAEFAFVDGVQELMISTLTRSQSLSAVQVLQNISRVIEKRAGSAGSGFTALMNRPADGAAARDRAGPQFALLSPEALRLLAPRLPAPRGAVAGPKPPGRDLRLRLRLVSGVEREPELSDRGPWDSPGSALELRILEANGNLFVHKSVSLPKGSRNPNLYHLLENEIRATVRLAETFGGRMPTELPRLIGYNVDVEEPFALLAAYAGQPAADAVGSFDDRRRRQFQVSLLRALDLAAAAGVVHGAVRLAALRWDGANVQLVDFESARMVGESSADSSHDVPAAGQVLRQLAVGGAAPVSRDDPESLRDLLKGVFGPASRRPSAADLLSRLGVVVNQPPLAGSGGLFARGQQAFAESSRRKRASLGPTPEPEPAPILPLSTQPTVRPRWWRRDG
jgi:hypothetical protein